MNVEQHCDGRFFLCAVWVALSVVGWGTFTSVTAEEKMAADTYYYDPAGKRDPFKSPFHIAPEKGIDEESKMPLQRFDLGQLKLVGVIYELGEPKALIEDSAGAGYIVTKGTLIGSKGGIVKKIEPKRILVEEYETDFYGKRQVREREMPLFVTDSAQAGGKTR